MSVTTFVQVWSKIDVTCLARTSMVRTCVTCSNRYESLTFELMRHIMSYGSMQYAAGRPCAPETTRRRRMQYAPAQGGRRLAWPATRQSGLQPHQRRIPGRAHAGAFAIVCSCDTTQPHGSRPYAWPWHWPAARAAAGLNGPVRAVPTHITYVCMYMMMMIARSGITHIP